MARRSAVNGVPHSPTAAEPAVKRRAKHLAPACCKLPARSPWRIGWGRSLAWGGVSGVRLSVKNPRARPRPSPRQPGGSGGDSKSPFGLAARLWHGRYTRASQQLVYCLAAGRAVPVHLDAAAALGRKETGGWAAVTPLPTAGLLLSTASLSTACSAACPASRDLAPHSGDSCAPSQKRAAWRCSKPPLQSCGRGRAWWLPPVLS
jgi:hypothetical protein